MPRRSGAAAAAAAWLCLFGLNVGEAVFLSSRAPARESRRLSLGEKRSRIPVPAPAPAPFPAPFPFEVPPRPLCNWTLDPEGVARPANCTTLPEGNVSCVLGPNMTFDPAGDCEPPPLMRCSNPMNNGDMDPELYFAEVPEGESVEHGSNIDIRCADNATAVDHEHYPLEAWATDWYPGVKFKTVVCNNGSLTAMEMRNMTFVPGHPFFRPASSKPIGLRCEPTEQVKLTQDVVHYLRWQEPHMQVAETRGYKWVDMDAILHKKLLKDAMNESAFFERKARNDGVLAPIFDLKRVIKAMLDNRMIPRGEPMNAETCADLEKHWLYQLKNSDPFKTWGNIGFGNWVPKADEKKGVPLESDIKLERPIKFKCSYTLQKAAAGYDPFTRIMNYHYRDGCFCETGWNVGCPFRADHKPNFFTFGFDALEVKQVSTAVGAATNALCWYFTKPANPEWGYMRTDLGFAYQAPAKNVTQLKAEWLKLSREAQNARFAKTDYASLR